MLARRFVVACLAVALVVAGPTAAFAAAVPVACGDTLAGSGILTGDLDCTFPQEPITIRHGRLDLQGFALIGGLVCEGSCKVANGTLGGGITAAKSIGLRNVVKYGDLLAEGNIVVKDSTVSFGQRCLSSYSGKVTVVNSVVDWCEQAVGASQSHAKVTGSTITNARHQGVLGTRVILKNSSVAGSGFGVECGHSPLDRICDGGADEGLECGPGVDCVGGNCLRGAICGDVLSFKRPAIRNSTCDTSVVANSAPLSWYECGAD